MAQRMQGWGDAARQYGYLNSIMRVFKKILKLLGFHIETYFLLYRDLDESDSLLICELPQSMSVVRIAYQDFEESRFFPIFPNRKKKLYQERFQDPQYEAYGVERNGELVYITWISTSLLTIHRIGIQNELKAGEGVLVDSFVLPEARGLGIHLYMNGFRLKRLQEKGVRRVYAAVLGENRPALKTQIKHRLEHGEKITRINLWGFMKYRRRDVDFSSHREGND